MNNAESLAALRHWASTVRHDRPRLPEGVSASAAWDAQKHGLNAVRAVRDDVFYFKNDGPCVADFAVGEARRAVGAALAAVSLGRNL